MANLRDEQRAARTWELVEACEAVALEEGLHQPGARFSDDGQQAGDRHRKRVPDANVTAA